MTNFLRRNGRMKMYQKTKDRAILTGKNKGSCSEGENGKFNFNKNVVRSCTERNIG
jgi:hypothetical protein